MGYSQHSGVVLVADGSAQADKRLARVLLNDPGTGAMRHADAGYEVAAECAKEMSSALDNPVTPNGPLAAEPPDEKGEAGLIQSGNTERSLAEVCGAAALVLEFYSSKTKVSAMSCEATLRQSGGSIILSIPKSIAKSMAVDAGSVVELQLDGRSLSITPARRDLADRLAQSPKTPASWHRDDASLHGRPVGRELL